MTLFKKAIDGSSLRRSSSVVPVAGRSPNQALPCPARDLEAMERSQKLPGKRRRRISNHGHALQVVGSPFRYSPPRPSALDPNQFTDFEGRPRYGAIIWDAPDPISSSDEELLAEAVEKLHTSLIVLGDRLQPPVIQRLLGIHYKGSWMHSAHPMVTGQSFLLRGLPDDLRTDGPRVVAMQRQQVDLLGAQALAAAGGLPQITERDLGNDTRAIWIGGDLDYMLLYQPMRTVLRRSITEAIGYALEKTWTNDIVLTMDDLGNAQNSWLEHWHYPALTEEQIRRYLIEPLKAHHAVLSINTVPGLCRR